MLKKLVFLVWAALLAFGVEFFLSLVLKPALLLVASVLGALTIGLVARHVWRRLA